MKRIHYAQVILFVMFTGSIGLAQRTTIFTNANGDVHLSGPFEISRLTSDSLYADWWKKEYNSFDDVIKDKEVKKRLSELEVDIYLGTWCGDSKRWVPRFEKLWNSLGLSISQLHFVALYDGTDPMKYKQGPNHEEKGKNIHRVPTFIFSKKGKEKARIVESPVNSLSTDLSQIAYGIPSEPNYRAVTYLQQLLATKTIEEIKENLNVHLYEVYRRVHEANELNTFGYVLWGAGKMDEAELSFYLNTRLFPYEPNVYDSYAELLSELNRNDEAIENYKKVLLLDRSNTHARKALRELQ